MSRKNNNFSFEQESDIDDIDLLADDIPASSNQHQASSNGATAGQNSNPFKDPSIEDQYIYPDVELVDLQSRIDTSSAPLNSNGNPFADSNQVFDDDNDILNERVADNRRDLPDFNSPNESKFDIKMYWSKLLGKPYSKVRDNSSPRIIHLNDPVTNSHFRYMDNHISTTKYNLATFVPKFLFEQFSKYANLFFLFTSIIQQIPGVTPTNRYTTIGTLLVVLTVSAIKEIMEDLKRNSADKELNSSKTMVLDSKAQNFVPKSWLNLKVGEIVKVSNGEPFPADLLLLSSSEPEALCYIETANLDGETNLKIKQGKSQTSHLTSPRQLCNLQGKVLSENPNSSLYTYEGTITFDNQEVALSPDQMLLRGANLKNTNWVVGLVVFTGHETKLMRNATAAPIKRTNVERIINLQILALFGILITLSLISSLGNIIKLQLDGNELGYLDLENTNKVGLFFKNILTFWILFSNLVPISLFVSVELIKYYQAFMIASDLDIYDEEKDTPTVCRTSSLVEELGQIEYIFSDKTGTLTRNIMEYKASSIAGRCYIKDIPEDRRAIVGDDGIEIGFHNFEEMYQDLNSDELGNIINEFFTLLATCHTVIPEVQDDGTIKYQAASPDEGALVQGAADVGYRFTVRKPNSVVFENTHLGRKYTYELLDVLEFNSTRKRMSGIFKCPDGRIRLYSKGADTVIFERLSPSGNHFVEATTRHLEDFAAEGLRTLCIATRVISEEEYLEWKPIHDKASTTLVDRQQKMDDAAELIEKDLFLLGATAIEDKLQDGVPDTISSLQEAGIKIWILTGDRQETAINIGMSCRLLSEDMNLLVINEDSKEETRDNMLSKLTALHENQVSAEDMRSLALVIDGKSLGYALDPDLEDYFLEIGVMCRAVICCRVSPLQKALVVKMVKRRKKALLLAIGDGANDVSMIQAAHVGIGISGMEGMQAARSADFSISQFKFLKKLLIVHGAWSYQRISEAILYSFYKNIALYMIQFWYAFSNAYSGQTVVESWTLTLYNVFYTVAPPIVIGIFDQFVSARYLDRYPRLYRVCQKGTFFNVTIFWGWVINGFYHSAVIYLCSIFIYRYGNVLSGGQVADHWTFGTAVFTSCTLTALGKAALVTNLWTKFTLLAIPGSFGFWLLFFPFHATVGPLINVSQEYRGIIPSVYGSLTFWAMTLVVPIMCLLRDILWKYYRRMYHPETYHFVQEIQKYNIQDHKPRVTHFQKAIRKVRQVHRMRKQRGFAFSQADEGQDKLVRLYDTTKKRDINGVLW
ncbi:Aminophospholipid translocase (flippase) [Komagataella phaffii CBS 7435]|uniref:Phospholipid-transporting ATPase n=2 Tax=Komagataella phaffii TaxID=460519 RepID=C4R8J5_KOMPG|nr:Aminophospholipid translocase (flippase) that maintains membrane lipid asymmetry in post-Golgi secre [Komagataella phaffii GS115]AOA64370.1 GQ67_05037T0 [Komagataella phaffii]CAH2450678.1 Aminophospholipid translocase (flippase) [Komagataella phaffii CBS 7435]AOA69533.1 GQ68_05018T0 [Komagataella phaffii GS115]CAY71920.1 Aminophospholipid translocase (flippase) that maintains membrane lipid asymmetry in post-Golgi secre [Komagataella phaffii GS115]CCA40478.1 Aminophospholipid translocase (f